MVDLTAMASALASLNAAKDIAQAMIGLRDAAAFQSKMIEFQSKILDAQNSAFAAQDERTALVDRVDELEKEVARLKAWDAEKEKYELRPMNAGDYPPMACALKAERESPKPSHWLCANCCERGEKRYLQPETLDVGRALVYKCQECGSELYVVGVRQPEHGKPKSTSRYR